MQPLGSIPEQGQLAVVRQRRYVVTDVRSGGSGGQIAERPQHLVSLTSIEDDALGEELQVIWDIEPGALRLLKVLKAFVVDPLPYGPATDGRQVRGAHQQADAHQ
jgi:hypothetical protein